MKRGLLICLAFLLVFTFFINFVVAETSPQTETQETTSQDSPEKNLEDLKNIGETLKNKPNEILSKEITLPEKIETPARIVFGLQTEDKLDMQFFIILTCVLIFVLLIFRNLIQFIPSFSKNTAWIGALVPSLIFSATGGARYVVVTLLDLGNVFSILEKWGPLKLGLGIILIIVIYYITSIIMGIIKETVVLGKAVKDGLKAGAQIAKLKAMAEMEEVTG